MAAALAVQVVACGVAVSGEATADKNGVDIAGEIPMMIAFGGTLFSVLAFRRSLASAHVWCKWRWYGVLAVLDPLAIFVTAIGTRQLIFPEPPVLREEDAADLRAIASTLGLTCFDDPFNGLNLEACSMAWARVYFSIAQDGGPSAPSAATSSSSPAAAAGGGEGAADETATAGWRLTRQSLLSCTPTQSELLAPAGIVRLIVFLQDPEHGAPFLTGLFNVLRSAEAPSPLTPSSSSSSSSSSSAPTPESVGFVAFCKVLLALQAAVEGNQPLQCELLFRAMNTAGDGMLSKAELGAWLSKIVPASDALDKDLFVESRWLTGVYQRKLSGDELIRSYFKRFDEDGDGKLSFQEFQQLCAGTNLRSGVFQALAPLLEDGEASPVLQAGRLLQFLMLNPNAGKLPRKAK